MAGVQVETGRRGADGSINMVPMIDLMVSMIAFLLMAAVWSESGTVRAQQPRGASDAPPVTTPDNVLRVVMSPTGIAVGRTAGDIHPVAAAARADDALRRALAEHRRADPTLRNVSIQPDSAVAYDDLLHAMDVVYDVWNEGAPGPRHRDERVTVSLL